MKISPWAKLMSWTMPYTIVYPMAIRPYIEPRNSPLASCCGRVFTAWPPCGGESQGGGRGRGARGGGGGPRGDGGLRRAALVLRSVRFGYFGLATPLLTDFHSPFLTW